MSRCLGCGAYCDGDVCDYRCEQQAEAYRIESLLNSGAMVCCRDCSEPTLKSDLDGWQCCESCAERNNERAAERQAERDANR